MVERHRRRHAHGEEERNADGDEQERASEDDEEVGVESLEELAVVDESDDGVLAEVIEVLVRKRDVDVVEDRKKADQPDPDHHRRQVGQRQPEAGSVHPVAPRPLEKERTAACRRRPRRASTSHFSWEMFASAAFCASLSAASTDYLPVQTASSAFATGSHTADL